MNEQEFAELAAGHALYALSAEDEARYASALRAHPEWADLAESDIEIVAALADGVSPVVPGADVRDMLLARIASTPQLADDPGDAPSDDARTEPWTKPDESRGRPRKLRILFALAASVALLVGIGFGSIALNNQLNRSPSVVALAEIGAAADAAQASVPLGGGGTATVHWSTDVGAAVLVAEGLESLSSEETYQLWFVRGQTPVPAGVFEPERGETIALLTGDMHAGDVVAVTVEQAGGLRPACRPATRSSRSP